MPGVTSFSVAVTEKEAALRLDAWLAARLSSVTRNRIRHLIQSGAIRVNGQKKRPSYRVKSGDQVTGEIPDPAQPSPAPESQKLEVVLEDEALVVLNKPPGLVVHPAPGHFSGTLVNALLFRYPELKEVGDPLRPGIVHRLDKDTSGLLLVARNSHAHQHLARQFKARQVVKRYLTVVHGNPKTENGVISLPVGRHPRDRKRMSTISVRGRSARTEWRVRERFLRAALLEVDLKTGRTHQIRVHLAALGHPVAGDLVYGIRKRPTGSGLKEADALQGAKRQMLHAWRLRIVHPSTLRPLELEAPLPEDMQDLLVSLRTSSPPQGGKPG